jgi:cytochrome oxidase Cu insertion factor (SCO1/SenC/PrrC family)
MSLFSCSFLGVIATLFSFTFSLSAVEDPLCCLGPDALLERGTPSEWIVTHKDPKERPVLPREFSMHDADNAALPEIPLGHRPTAIVFFYTRCTNPNKCPALMNRFAGLRSKLDEQGLKDRVDMLAISYDAYRERPEDLMKYADNLGPKAQGIHLLVPEPDEANRLFRAWSIRGQTSAVGVAAHTNELFLLDREGRLYQHHEVYLWNDNQVISVLQTLADEP